MSTRPTHMSADYDAVVVGASIAGCTAATLLARAGARVALVERHSHAAAYKKTCTHYFQGCSIPTLNRLGLTPALESAGAVPNHVSIWSRFGWISPPAGPDHPHPHGYNIRRETFDPMVRALAAATPGVELMLGHAVKELTRDRDRVSGVVVQDRQGTRRRIRARLTVAADGRDSKVAELVGSPGTPATNARFIYWAYYRGMQAGYGRHSRTWFLDPGFAYVFPNEDDITLVGVLPTKQQLPEFKRNTNDAYTRYLATLPDPAPPIAEVERVSPLIGKLDITNRSRRAARPGLAFVGDAALTSDPLWGVGCGWALQSAQWLADTVGSVLVKGGDVDAALTAYRRLHRRRLAPHHFLICDYSRGRKLNSLEKVIFSAAADDPGTALAVHSLANRTAPVHQALSPRVIAKATAVTRRRRRRSPRPTNVQPSSGSHPRKDAMNHSQLERLGLAERLQIRMLVAHQLLYERTDGRLGHRMLGVPCLLLRTVGAKSGRHRTNGLVYARDGENYLVVASNGGAPRAPGWYHNLRANPRAEIQIGRNRYPATARIVQPGEADYDRLWNAVNAVNNDRYRTYQKITTRPIPLVALTPGSD